MNPLDSLSLIPDAANDQRLFQNPLDVHKGRQRSIGVLLHIPHMGVIPVHPLLIQFRKILAIEDHLPLCRLVESQDGFHQARFPTTAFPNDSDGLPFMHLKIHAVHSLYITGMTKPKASQLKPDTQALNRQQDFSFGLLFFCDLDHIDIAISNHEIYSCSAPTHITSSGPSAPLVRTSADLRRIFRSGKDNGL